MSGAPTGRGPAWPIVVHSLRTAIACVASLLVARLFRLPEAYWAPITTVVITQSSVGAALAVSWDRFLGTVLGVLVGAALATWFGPHALAFGIGVFVLGLFRIVTHSDLTVYRIGGVALAIVLLVPRTGPPWHRLSSIRRSVHRHRRGADVLGGVARERVLALTVV